MRFSTKKVLTHTIFMSILLKSFIFSRREKTFIIELKSYRKILAHNWLVMTESKNNDLEKFSFFVFRFFLCAIKNSSYNDDHKIVNRKKKFRVINVFFVLSPFAFFRDFMSQWISFERCEAAFSSIIFGCSSENLIILKIPQTIIFVGDRNTGKPPRPQVASNA